VEDATALQHKVDNMTFQVKLKDKDINNLTEIKSKLENMVTGLRTEVKRVESEMNGKNCVIHALKEQIKFYKVQCQDMDNQKRELERLRKNVESLKTYALSYNCINCMIDA
jgi:chromosome segregation ATPase